MQEKPDVTWIQDSSGQTSCHVNDGGLNFQQSLIGTLSYRADGCRVILKDGTDITPADGCASLSRARMCLEDYAQKNVIKKAPRVIERVAPRSAQPGRA